MITKYLLPLIAIIGMAAGSAGTLYISKLIKPKIELTCPKCPDLKCPEQKPCNGIDFDKIKSRNVTIDNKQYLTIQGDSLAIESIRAALKAELESFKVRKCR